MKKIIIMLGIFLIIMTGCTKQYFYSYPTCEFIRKEYGEWEKVNSQTASTDNQQLMSLDGYEVTNEYSANVSIGLLEAVNFELGYSFSISSLTCAGTVAYANRGQTIDFYCRPIYDVYEITEIKYRDEEKRHEISRNSIEFGQLRSAQYAWTISDENNIIIEDTRNNPIWANEKNIENTQNIVETTEVMESPTPETSIGSEKQSNIMDNSVEKATISEMHSPNDTATYVWLEEWDASNDYGIDGIKYDWGFKITIGNMFSTWGSGLDNEVNSRLVLKLSEDQKRLPDNEKYLRGVLVLHESMYGKKSSGTINILVNNKEIFTTGEIDGNVVDMYPFEIFYGDADSIIVEANVILRGSEFIYGFVDEKK